MKIEHIIPLQLSYALDRLNVIKHNLIESNWQECLGDIALFYYNIKTQLENAHNEIANIIQDATQAKFKTALLYKIVREKSSNSNGEVAAHELHELYNKISIYTYFFSFSQWLMMKSEPAPGLDSPIITSSLAAIGMKVIDTDIPKICRYSSPTFFRGPQATASDMELDISSVYQGLLKLIKPLNEAQIMSLFRVLFEADASITSTELAQRIIDAVTSHAESYNLWELSEVHALAPGLLQMINEYKQLAARTLSTVPLIESPEATIASDSLPPISSL